MQQRWGGVGFGVTRRRSLRLYLNDVTAHLTSLSKEESAPMQVLLRILCDGSVSGGPGTGFWQGDGLLVPLNPTLPVTPSDRRGPLTSLCSWCFARWPGNLCSAMRSSNCALTKAVLKVYSLAQVHAVVSSKPSSDSTGELSWGPSG